MKIYGKNYISIILIALSFIILVLFLQQQFLHQSYEHNKYTIIATTSMLADAVRIITDGRMVVHCLMGPGIDPHLYRARESDVHKLAAADLVIYNGLHLEGKMEQVLEGMNRFTNVLNASSVIDKRKLRIAEFEGLYDPHIWFDINLWIMVVSSIEQAIISLDPEHANIYKKNSDDYIAELERLHFYIQQRINEVDAKKRILITAHDAFGYFGDAYHFKVVGLQGLSTDCDISTKDIQELSDYIVENKIPTIFIESSISARSLRAVQEAVIAQGWHVAIGDELYSDALGDAESGASSYLQMVKYNIDTIVDALQNVSCDTSENVVQNFPQDLLYNDIPIHPACIDNAVQELNCGLPQSVSIKDFEKDSSDYYCIKDYQFSYDISEKICNSSWRECPLDDSYYGYTHEINYTYLGSYKNKHVVLITKSCSGGTAGPSFMLGIITRDDMTICCVGARYGEFEDLSLEGNILRFKESAVPAAIDNIMPRENIVGIGKEIISLPNELPSYDYRSGFCCLYEINLDDELLKPNLCGISFLYETSNYWFPENKQEECFDTIVLEYIEEGHRELDLVQTESFIKDVWASILRSC